MDRLSVVAIQPLLNKEHEACGRNDKASNSQHESVEDRPRCSGEIITTLSQSVNKAVGACKASMIYSLVGFASSMLSGILILGTIELVGSFAKGQSTESQAIGDSVLSLSTRQSHAVDVCFVNGVTSQQPLWLVFLSGVSQVCVNIFVFGVKLDKDPSMSSFGIAAVLIVLKAKSVYSDMHSLLTLPWWCSQIIGSGSSQLPTIFQALVRISVLNFNNGTCNGRPMVAKGHWYLAYTYMLITIPYVPLVFFAVFADLLPGLCIFFPVAVLLVLLLGVIAFLIFVFGSLLKLLGTNVSDAGLTQFVYTIQIPGLCLLFKFIGESMARFYSGQGWWDALYTTWAERNLVGYTHFLWGSFDNVITTAALYL